MQREGAHFGIVKLETFKPGVSLFAPKNKNKNDCFQAVECSSFPSSSRVQTIKPWFLLGTQKSPRLPCRATQERASLSADPTSTHHHWRHSNLRSLWGTWGFVCCSERNPAILETRTRIGWARVEFDRRLHGSVVVNKICALSPWFVCLLLTTWQLLSAHLLVSYLPPPPPPAASSSLQSCRARENTFALEWGLWELLLVKLPNVTVGSNARKKQQNLWSWGGTCWV